MARFFGAIGYAHSTVETPPNSGVYVQTIVEHLYYGDILRNIGRSEGSQKINPDISVNNSISVVADGYANEYFHAIRYVRWREALWTVTSVELRAPRLILELGGVYDGPTP